MKLTILGVVGLVTVAAETSRGATYNAVSDFNGATNPSGAWTYLSSPSSTAGVTPVVLTPSGHQDGNAQDEVYSSGLPFPNTRVVVRNFGPGNTDFDTVVVPPTLLRLDPQGGTVDVEWTAPSAGTYAIGGLFQIIDTAPHGHEVRVLRDDNSATPFLDAVLTNPTYGGQTPFNFTATFATGETVDFVVNSSGDPYLLSTGLAATISSVPEPTSAVVALLAVPAFAGRRRRHR